MLYYIVVINIQVLNMKGTEMPNNFRRKEIGKQIFLSTITDSRFKANLISINFFSPLSEEVASENAVVSRYLSKCCQKYPTYASLNNKLSAMYSAVLSGGNVNFMGDCQLISFSINYIDGRYALEGENMNEMAVDMIAECLFNPLADNGKFNEKFIALEKQSVIDDIESEINDKQAYASRKAAEVMFRGEPYAIRELGTVEKTKQVTPLSAYKAYLRIMQHCRIEIICSGASDFEDIKPRLISLFSKLNREEIFDCETSLSPLKPKPEKVTETMDVKQSKMILGFKTDFNNNSAMEIMNILYGGSPSSKLFENVREKMSLCYSCWSSVNKLKGCLFVKCGVDKENIAKAYDEILSQLEKMKKGEFSDEDIINAKMYRKNYLKTYNDSLNVMAVWYLTHIYCDEILSPEETILKDERVTKEDIVKAAESLKLDTFYVLAP